MTRVAPQVGVDDYVELPASASPRHHRVFGPDAGGGDTGLLFDTRYYAVLSITHPADSRTPELNTDKDGDRVVILLEGDLSLQIGGNRFRLNPGDAVLIPRGTTFGRSASMTGAHILLIRTKALRSFSMYR